MFTYKPKVIFRVGSRPSSLEQLKRLQVKVNWEIEAERFQLLRRLDPLIRGWKGQLPDLRDIFRSKEMDWFLIENLRYSGSSSQEIIAFVARCGYKDQPEDDENNRPSLRRTTPLHHVARGNLALKNIMIRDLFEIYDRFDVNYIDDESGLTHFHVACMFGRDAVVEKFLELGQDPNCSLGSTAIVDSPLHLALKHGRRYLFELLLRRGADPNAVDSRGATPLHCICRRNDDAAHLAEMLFELSQDGYRPVRLDVRDLKGNTPLHLALHWNRTRVTEALLRRGGGVAWNLVNGQGWTPLQLAVANIMPSVVDVLLSRGGGVDLTSFVFPTLNIHFDDTFTKADDIKKLRLASGALAVVEQLERRGYRLGQRDALRIMQFFTRHELFERSEEPDNRRARPWYRDENFVRESKKLTILPGLSLHDLIQLRPDEAEGVVAHRDYFELARSDRWRLVSEESTRACVVHLCEKLSRRFFRRWAAEFVSQLTRRRVPIVCCDLIVDGSFINENLYDICLSVIA